MLELIGRLASWWYVRKSAGKGRPHVYSDKAIETCLTIAYLFRMPLRMAEGFVNSFFTKEKEGLKAPCYTQMSRRASSIKLPEIKLLRGQQLHLAFDSTGLKVFGEGEWKVRAHGASKRRTWRKLHLSVDIESLQIMGASLTANSVDDASVAAEMLTNKFNGCVQEILGDGAYDVAKIYEACRSIGANVIVPPNKNAKIQTNLVNPAKLPRDHAIARIRMLGGDDNARKLWKKEVAYHQRSLAETTMYRFKSTFSDKLKHKKFENQLAEALIKANTLNRIASIGFGGNR